MIALPLCRLQMSKRQQNGKLSNVVLSLDSLQQQMLLVIGEISMTIAVYQVQGHSESSAMRASRISQELFKYFMAER